MLLVVSHLFVFSIGTVCCSHLVLGFVFRINLEVNLEDKEDITRCYITYTFKYTQSLISYVKERNMFAASEDFEVTPAYLCDSISIDYSHNGSDIGEVILQGRLLHMGIKVTRSQLRSSIHRIDHSNTVARRSRVINQRVYSVPYPNAVWHIIK